MKIDSNDPKAKGRIRRRNMVAKAMLEDRRRFTERTIKNKRKENETRFNKHDILRGNYINEDD